MGTSDGDTASGIGERQRRRVRIQGIVQGVGFRPFVHRIARERGLAGHVLNFAGGVDIEVEGPPDAIRSFIAALEHERPPIAVIDSIEVEPMAAVGSASFEIIASEDRLDGPILVSPDVATCADCERELRDPANRRYGHPFINCTNCGPRFTIVRAAPYDRPLTSMAPFAMCPDCAAEYQDIGDRRYHAQPNSCHRCGPTLRYVVPSPTRSAGTRSPGGRGGAPPLPPGEVGRRPGEGQAVQRAHTSAVADLQAGRIVAIRGIGGFHLAVDATSDAAVRRLRERKHREEKPFALMVPDVATAHVLCEVSPEAEALLSSPQRPIVLLPARPGAVALSVAPDTRMLGLMLPYTPLHHLLMRDVARPALVMTSGNLSDEPLVTDNAEAVERLGGIADAFLVNDRDIIVPCDDSILRPTAAGPILMRRSRGYVPFPVRLAPPAGNVLAVGGHLKNTFCLTSGDRAFLSQHLGDLDDARSLSHFEWALDHLCDVLRLQPEAIACDEHPGYWSTRVAHRLAEERGLPLFAVQHHHAHVASCLADNCEGGRVIGLACDGTGHGRDGTVWGCEVFLAGLDDFQRLGHLRPIPLPGSEAAIREPVRTAAVLLWQAFGEGFLDSLDLPLCRRVADSWPVWRQMIDRGLNCPYASSAGRLFDGVSALLGLGDVATYEGQAAMKLEAAAADGEAPYPVRLADGGDPWVMDPAPMVRALAEDLRSDVDTAQIAGRFHATFALMLQLGAERAVEQTGVRTVALSGGTFQNALLLCTLKDRLERGGLRVLIHRAVPPNDGGLSLGQAAVAAAQREGRQG